MFLRAWLKSQKVGAGFGYAAGCGAVASPRLSGQTYFRGFAPGSGFAPLVIRPKAIRGA